MALVVFLKGVNVGGRRTFRPSRVAKRLKHFDAINIGAAGTFIIRRSTSRKMLRTAIRQLLPFEATTIICEGRDILELASLNPFEEQSSRRNIIQFVGIQEKRHQLKRALPFNVPLAGRWIVKALAYKKRFLIGLHRREMAAISHLGELEKLGGGTMTIRSWSTILTLARLLKNRSVAG